jgi:hypothetical protein
LCPRFCHWNILWRMVMLSGSCILFICCFLDFVAEFPFHCLCCVFLYCLSNWVIYYLLLSYSLRALSSCNSFFSQSSFSHCLCFLFRILTL